MLRLYCETNRDYNFTMSNEYKYYDTHFFGPNSVPGIGYVTSKNLESAMIPIAFNEIGIAQYTYSMRNEEDFDVVQERILEDYNNLSEERLMISRFYTTDVDAVAEKLNKDILTSVPNAIQELYNKCMAQTELRQELDQEIKIKVFSYRAKHGILIITNYDDVNQASDMFLTIGLVPVLCKDWKDKFNEDEIEYFKTLVNRSQVKRISNVKATEVFHKMCGCQKYKDLYLRIKLVNSVEEIVRQKIYRAENDVESYNEQAENLLRQYSSCSAKYYEACDFLSNIAAKKEDLIEEYKAACTVEGITNIDTRGSTMHIYCRVPATFFNADEAEIYVNGLKNRNRTNNEEFEKDYERTIKFFEDVFVDQKYKLYLLCIWEFNSTQPEAFNKPRAVEVSTLNHNNAHFNPHMHFYNCIGDYESTLRNLHAKQDLLMFNNTAIASTKSINFRDGAVMNRWKDNLVNWFHYYNQNYEGTQILDSKCLEDLDGKLHSLAELYMNIQETEPIDLEVQDL